MEISIAQLRELLGCSVTDESKCPFEVGQSYIIRTVTMINLGKVKKIVGNFLVLESAGWVADTGRYHVALATGVLNEFEPYPDISFVSLGSVVDAQPWQFELPLSWSRSGSGSGSGSWSRSRSN